MFQDNYATYFDMYGDAQFNFSNLIRAVVGNLKTEEDMREAEEFFKNVDLGKSLITSLKVWNTKDFSLN